MPKVEILQHLVMDEMKPTEPVLLSLKNGSGISSNEGRFIIRWRG